MTHPIFVSVALDVPLLPPLTYKAADGTSPRVGDRCVVPLGKRQEVGLIVGLSDQTDVPAQKQKSYIRLLNETEPLGTTKAEKLYPLVKRNRAFGNYLA